MANTPKAQESKEKREERLEKMKECFAKDMARISKLEAKEDDETLSK